MTQVSLYLDDDSSSRLFSKALSQLVDRIVTTRAVGLGSAADSVHLEFAAANGLVMVTYNRRDFGRMHYEYLGAGRSHAGILLLEQQRVTDKEELRRFRNFLTRRTAESMVNELVYISEFRV